MKKLSIILLLVTAFTVSAQTAVMDHQNNVIEVYGDITYSPKIAEYQATIILTLDNYYYDSGEVCTFEELNNKFLKKLEEAGIDKKLLTEDKFEYQNKYYKKDGTAYHFAAASEEDFIKLSEIRLNGLSISNKKYLVDMSEESYFELYDKAFAEAKKKADYMAKKVDRKIGKVVMISDRNYTKNKYAYSNNDESYFSIRVAFELL